MSTNRHRRGRCERIANIAPTIGDKMIASSENNKDMLETEVFKKKLRTLRIPRSRIKHVREFLEQNYNENFNLGTSELTEEELQHQSKY